MCCAVSDVDSDHVVGRHEFADFIFHMAAADLAHGSDPIGEAAPKVTSQPFFASLECQLCTGHD